MYVMQWWAVLIAVIVGVLAALVAQMVWG